MRTRLSFVLALLLFRTVAFTQDRTTRADGPTTMPNAETLTLQAISAFSPAPITSVQLSGAARVVAGSSDESGTFDFNVKNNGDSDLHLALGLLSRTEKASAFGEDRSCIWISADGTEHQNANHNCSLALDWILPAFGLGQRYTELNKVLRIQIGNADQLLELSSTSAAARSSTQRLLRKLSTVDLKLDSSTVLPVSMTF